tara:strand:+ start:565 stop:759 length:195 start_codon:yes stop_codon:yes gene_type:complete
MELCVGAVCPSFASSQIFESTFYGFVGYADYVLPLAGWVFENGSVNGLAGTLFDKRGTTRSKIS